MKSNKDLTFEEKKELLDAISPDTPWLKGELTDINLSVKRVVKYCAQEIYGRNLSKMFEAHIVKQLREDGILPPVGTPLVRPIESSEQAAHMHVVKEAVPLTPDPKAEAKRRITRVGVVKSLKKR